MPKFVIERQYFMPVYQRLIIEADDAEDACQQAVEHDDWQSAVDDGEGSTGTTINAIKQVPDELINKIESEIDPGEFLWEDQPEYGERLPVPENFTTPDAD